MRHRRFWTAALFGIVAVIFTAWYLYFDHDRKTVGQPTTQDRFSMALSNARTVQGETPPVTAATSPTTRVEMTWQERMRANVETKNVPITFWGRVVSDDGSPLPRVQVMARVRSWNGGQQGVGTTFVPIKVNTGEDGQFKIDSVRGDVLTIESLGKEDYEAEPTGLRNYGYNVSTNHVPDPARPVTFRMWKAGTEQVLIKGEKFISVVPDGRTYTLDFVNGNVGEGEVAGDLRFALKRASDAAWGKTYDWSIDLECPAGGLAEEIDADSAMFLAPQSGYSPTFRVARLANDLNWSHGIGRRRFYVRSRDGKLHGRITVEVFAFYLKDKQARVKITYSVNPSGSRILR